VSLLENRMAIDAR